MSFHLEARLSSQTCTSTRRFFTPPILLLLLPLLVVLLIPVTAPLRHLDRESERERRRRQRRGEETKRRREITLGDLRRAGRLDACGRTWPLQNPPLRRVLPPNLPVGEGLLLCGVAARRKVQAWNRRSLFRCVVGLCRSGRVNSSSLVFFSFFFELWEGVRNMKTGGSGASWHRGIGTCLHRRERKSTASI